MPLTLSSTISAFGAEVKTKLNSAAATGEPEDQLRGPFERLITELSQLCGFAPGAIVAIGESSLSDMKTRPDYAISLQNALAGFVEIKAPGKGADPRRYKGHDKEQWQRLQSLPNLIYTDGNQFGLWRFGELSGSIVSLIGDIEQSGARLDAPQSLVQLFDDFLRWTPTPPRTPKQLAETTARLCRLLRDEVTEQLDQSSPLLTQLAADWRRILFPEASNKQFADGYAQAVTFGLLMARAHDIDLSRGLGPVARQLGTTNSLIGAALRLLTDEAQSQEVLKTSLGTLTRVLDAVNWAHISRGEPDAWLYFYEHFLEVYDNRLRKLTGSYYTPPGVVGSMVRLVDEMLRSGRFGLSRGLSAPTVTLADPAMGTGTFLLGALRQIAGAVANDEGAGAVPASIDSALGRMIAFELQLGPFAVAQLRVIAELTELTGSPPTAPLRMFVADTLSNPDEEVERFPLFGPIAESRREANDIKKNVPITVVIGNPPYKEKAKGRGSWVESGGASSPALLQEWMPPRDWGVGAHAKHLRNLYVYFWRWATWKVFDHDPEANTGMVCFITVAGFLAGPGFEKMRAYLRQKCDDIFVIDCSPEGHQPDVSTRIFEAVQQPVCIVLASRSPRVEETVPAAVHFRALAAGHRNAKFAELSALTLEAEGWRECPADWRAEFLPAATGGWATYPPLDAFFIYNGSGVMPGRTWVIAPDADSLTKRWAALTAAPRSDKDSLFVPHMQGGEVGDRHAERIVRDALPGFEARPIPVADDNAACVAPVMYAFRSFDRQRIIPDNRLLNRPNPELWSGRSARQLYLTAPSDRSPSNGPALTFTGEMPDLHHYAGRGGRVFPLWRDHDARESNVPASVLALLSGTFGRSISPEDLVAYIAGIASHPAFTEHFAPDLVRPGLRIPLTRNPELFSAVTDVGRRVIWLHTFGERFADPTADRPDRAPRLPAGDAPKIPAAGAIPTTPDGFPDTLEYDPATRRLHVGSGYIDNVSPEVWDYEVSGKQVLRQWFSYRKANRERPIIGDRRPPSKLSEIQPERWPAEYTTELINVLNVLGLLVELEPRQADLLEQVCSGPVITADEVASAITAAPRPPVKSVRERARTPEQHQLF